MVMEGWWWYDGELWLRRLNRLCSMTYGRVRHRQPAARIDAMNPKERDHDVDRFDEAILDYNENGRDDTDRIITATWRPVVRPPDSNLKRSRTPSLAGRSNGSQRAMGELGAWVRGMALARDHGGQ